MIDSHYPVVIVGAGPAGMAAAIAAAKYNIKVAVFDESPSPGGQIYRNVLTCSLSDEVMGKDYLYGANLVTTFLQADVDYFPGSSVWNIEKNGAIGVLNGGTSYLVNTDCLILATGAMERPVPFSGWTLPGVMHAGSGQIMLKQGGLAPHGKMVLAGTGPLLLLLASQYLKAGKRIEAIIDTTGKGSLVKALRHFPNALRAAPYLLKGLSLMAFIRRSGVKYFRQAVALTAKGKNRVESVSFRSNGKDCQIESDWLLTQFGVIPNSPMTALVGCEQYWDNSQYCWRPVVDSLFNSSIKNIKIIGDLNGIFGAKAAELEGQLAVIDLLAREEKISGRERSRMERRLRRALSADTAIRPLLQAFYPPYPANRERLSAETIICRCEEVSAGAIREAVRNGVTGVNQLKAFTRCGMGPCQGRQCGQAASQLVSQLTGRDVSEAGYFRPRSPLKPLTLGQMASANVPRMLPNQEISDLFRTR